MGLHTSGWDEVVFVAPKVVKICGFGVTICKYTKYIYNTTCCATWIQYLIFLLWLGGEQCWNSLIVGWNQCMNHVKVIWIGQSPGTSPHTGHEIPCNMYQYFQATAMVRQHQPGVCRSWSSGFGHVRQIWNRRNERNNFGIWMIKTPCLQGPQLCSWHALAKGSDF